MFEFGLMGPSRVLYGSSHALSSLNWSHRTSFLFVCCKLEGNLSNIASPVSTNKNGRLHSDLLNRHIAI
jgi:hypothetical protein